MTKSDVEQFFRHSVCDTCTRLRVEILRNLMLAKLHMYNYGAV